MSKTVNVIVSGGVVIDVEGLPEGWDVAITDLDDDCLAAEMDSGDVEMLQEQLRKFSPPQEYDDE